MENAPVEIISSATIETFSSLLHDMSPQTVDTFVGILSAGGQFNLKSLRELIPETDALYPTYQTFFSSHSIEFAYGNNSKNFVLVSKTDQQAYMLKIENRLKAPQEFANYLREEVLPDVITPIYAERDANFTAANGDITLRTIQLTTLCEQGSLEDLAMDEQDPSKRVHLALDYYSQMVSILKRMRENDCFFPDMKNANWLVNSEGKLKIADTKSFLHTTAEGIHDISLKANEGYSLLKTYQFSPPELLNQNTFSAEKAHVSMFARNLYQFLTACDSNELDNPNLNFGASIFKTPEGKRLQALIETCNQISPEQRPSLDSILVELETIQNLQKSKDEIMELLKSMTIFNLGDEQDDVLVEYLDRQINAIYQAENTQDLELIQQDILDKLNHLRQQETANMIIDFTNQALSHSNQYSPTLITQLTKLKTDLLCLPLDQRQSTSLEITTLSSQMNYIQKNLDNYTACEKILREIASQRISSQDTQMNEFIQEKNGVLQTASDTHHFQTLHQELQKTLQDVQAGEPLINNIKQVILQKNTKNNPLKIGKNLTGENIQKALGEVPIRERKDILIADTSTAKEVRANIATRHGFFGQTKPKDVPAEKLKKWIDQSLINDAVDVRDRYTQTIQNLKQQGKENKILDETQGKKP